jgi:hypothetical protein
MHNEYSHAFHDAAVLCTDGIGGRFDWFVGDCRHPDRQRQHAHFRQGDVQLAQQVSSGRDPVFHSGG